MATYWENSCSFGLRYVSWNRYLIVSLVFSHLGFWSGNLFLIAPFPDLCLLVPFHQMYVQHKINAVDTRVPERYWNGMFCIRVDPNGKRGLYGIMLSVICFPLSSEYHSIRFSNLSGMDAHSFVVVGYLITSAENFNGIAN